ncbi:hypothetical protein JQ617_08020 [Bradyrhizobium sp. KB893862 SZCCT0404]|uniref:hypothetical protein n=1 Tax=Bradyrhizobium sp. KB893862 SZCCT0404 TaxID=2807672 RepID=UPI001BA92CF5|nr:hypothetical protein [Bradyrhizobium sp. KB893862 SZCCT0404]MBR1173896.1 hypothetical protein [Bradyrhizobium sp. KB893862 SZCCT0404]
MQRTDDEILAVGAYARSLMTDETFNALYREYTDGMLANIIASQPHEVKVREFEYAQIRAMTGFMSHLVGLAESAAKIIEKNAPSSSQDDELED